MSVEVITYVVLIGLKEPSLCPECRTSVVLVAIRPFSRNMSREKLPTEWKNGTGRLPGGPFAAANCLLAELDHSV
jgi:hypothetical protein